MAAAARTVRERLAAEIGTIRKDAPGRVALVYPSPYDVAMSSLGYQTLYRAINARTGFVAERAFLPDDGDDARSGLRTYESGQAVGDFPIVAVSVAFELELAGLVSVLDRAGIPALAQDRKPGDPFVLLGGPLTFSNPLPLAPFADAVLLGEADETLHIALDVLTSARSREHARRALADAIDSCWVPTLHADVLPPLGRCDDALLPAFSQVITPHTELSSMFLVEPARGCSRGCTYCVMRRSTNGGMRIVPMERVLALVPAHAKKVGLVGAAVSDHPKIAQLVETLADRGLSVSLSSLRPDRLDDRLAAALRRGGYRTLTTAADGASQRVRDAILRKTREAHLERAATLARTHGFDRLKLYTMLGVPGEHDDDVDELVALGRRLSAIVPVALTVSPFVAKRNTPLDGSPFAGIDVVERRLAKLRRGLAGRVDLRSASARWAWVEHALAQGGRELGLAALEAARSGGSFAAWRRAIESRVHVPRRLAVVA
ncbi:MAG: radical SAM protein [Deltaproteobacteria bacterium]|nr:radical SAM protein [Deltaproteobacteria bacterium]